MAGRGWGGGIERVESCPGVMEYMSVLIQSADSRQTDNTTNEVTVVLWCIIV